MLAPNGTTLTCKDRTGATVVAQAIVALGDFKNPYDTGTGAVSVTLETVGSVNIVDDGSNVTVKTCFAEVGDTPECKDDDSKSTVTNTIAIE